MKPKIGLRIRELDGKLGGIQLSNSWWLRAYHTCSIGVLCFYFFFIFLSILIWNSLSHAVPPTRDSKPSISLQSINISISILHKVTNPWQVHARSVATQYRDFPRLRERLKNTAHLIAIDYTNWESKVPKICVITFCVITFCVSEWIQSA